MKGTPAQINFAEDVKAKWMEVASKVSHPVVSAFFNNDDAGFWCDTCPKYFERVKDAPAYRVFQAKILLSYIEDSVFGTKESPTPFYVKVSEMKASGADKAAINALYTEKEAEFESVEIAMKNAVDVRQEAPRGVC